MNDFDKTVESQLKNDKLDTKPSTEVFNHLRNQMLISSATSRIKQNSLLPSLNSLVGNKNLTWKISVAAVLLISFMGIKHIEQNNLYIQSADSIQTHQNSDTLSFQLADSSFTY